MTCLTMDLLGFVPFGICSASCICLSICVSCQFGGVCSDHFFEYSQTSFSFLLSSWDSEMIKMLVLLLESCRLLRLCSYVFRSLLPRLVKFYHSFRFTDSVLRHLHGSAEPIRRIFSISVNVFFSSIIPFASFL